VMVDEVGIEDGVEGECKQMRQRREHAKEDSYRIETQARREGGLCDAGSCVVHKHRPNSGLGLAPVVSHLRRPLTKMLGVVSTSDLVVRVSIESRDECPDELRLRVMYCMSAIRASSNPNLAQHQRSSLPTCFLT
jgi:hypothetical protein